MEGDTDARATSFGQAADHYRRARPGYPEAVVRWLVPSGATRVLDLAAGTGKLTERLVDLDVEVIAVEPDTAMLDALRRAVPAARALEGRAEAIPVEDAAVDVVVVAQAWHWFDPATAVPEVARVLRPGGRLGIVANVHDDTVDWVQGYTEIIGRGDAPPPVDSEPVLDDTFGPLETFEVGWANPMTVDDLVTLAASRSNVLAMAEDERAQLLADVERLARTHPDLAGRDGFELPYRTKAWRATRRRAASAPGATDAAGGWAAGSGTGTVRHPVRVSTPSSHRASSFGRAADAYRRARPGYPDAAARWLVPESATRVLDLAAGTGKLTERLVELGVEVVAVEPDDAMRAQLLDAAPGARALAGRADDIPLEDASVDAVVVAQAWHWFDPATALPEIARVLRPGGRLGVAWNVRDHRVGWVDAYTELIHRGDSLDPLHGEPALDHRFGDLEQATFEWRHRMPVRDLVTLAESRSNVLTLPERERAELLADVAELTRTHPDLAGRDVVEMPYRTTCWRAALR